MKWRGSSCHPHSAARQSAELRRRNAFTYGAWGGRKQMFSNPKVFLQDKHQNGNCHRGGGESSFPHFNCTSAVWRARRREGHLAQNKIDASPNQSLEAPRGFITNPAFFTVMDNMDSHRSPSSPFLSSALSFLTAGITPALDLRWRGTAWQRQWVQMLSALQHPVLASQTTLWCLQTVCSPAEEFAYFTPSHSPSNEQKDFMSFGEKAS